MRFKGVRVDEEKTKTFGEDIKKEKQEIIRQIEKETNISIDIWASDSIKPLLDKLDIKDYKVTPKTGRASITKII